MDIDPRHLRILLSIAEHGTFTRAAAAQRISQPAMSSAIARLETLDAQTSEHTTKQLARRHGIFNDQNAFATLNIDCDGPETGARRWHQLHENGHVVLRLGLGLEADLEEDRTSPVSKRRMKPCSVFHTT